MHVRFVRFLVSGTGNATNRTCIRSLRTRPTLACRRGPTPAHRGPACRVFRESRHVARTSTPTVCSDAAVSLSRRVAFTPKARSGALRAGVVASRGHSPSRRWRDRARHGGSRVQRPPKAGTRAWRSARFEQCRGVGWQCLALACAVSGTLPPEWSRQASRRSRRLRTAMCHVRQIQSETLPAPSLLRMYVAFVGFMILRWRGVPRSRRSGCSGRNISGR